MTHTCTKVTVRQRAIRNNRISLYLDYYPAVRNPETMQMSRREYLGIYIYAHPKNEMEREFNNVMLNKAETIRCIRVQSLINEEFGFLDKTKMKADFLGYFIKMCRNKDQKWQFVYQHFYNFVKGHCTFGDVNVNLCKRFREYLLNAKQLKHNSRPISLNSASGYYSTFRGLLKIAYRDKWFRENINDYLDKIEPKDVKKEYLTLDEVKQLAATPCDIPVLKAASLFACLTGLRISDILNLQWEDFTIAPDQGYCLRIRTQKTQTETTLPISYEAYELCGTPDTGKVFKGLQRSMINYPLKNWLKKAGITKLDKIAYIINEYLSLGVSPKKISFSSIWYKDIKTRVIREDILKQKSIYSLAGLFFIRNDIFGGSSDFTQDSDTRLLNQIRNAMGHRAINITDNGAIDDSGFILKISRADFEKASMSLIHSVKQAIFCLTNMINHIEYDKKLRIKSQDQIIIPQHVESIRDDDKI